jgi:hypothetical protein
LEKYNLKLNKTSTWDKRGRESLALAHLSDPYVYILYTERETHTHTMATIPTASKATYEMRYYSMLPSGKHDPKRDAHTHTCMDEDDVEEDEEECVAFPCFSACCKKLLLLNV